MYQVIFHVRVKQEIRRKLNTPGKDTQNTTPNPAAHPPPATHPIRYRTSHSPSPAGHGMSLEQD
jgi:hypothetical protein